MTPGEAVEQLAVRALANGIDPLDLTAAIIEVITETIFSLTLAARDPRAVLLSRRIIACLLEAGWQPPDKTETT